MVHFPIDGLDLEERIGERKVAKSLHLSQADADAYGVETSDEPMIYDLCETVLFSVQGWTLISMCRCG